MSGKSRVSEARELSWQRGEKGFLSWMQNGRPEQWNKEAQWCVNNVK